MSYSLIFNNEAKKELDELDGSIRILVLKQIKKIMDNPELGVALGNKVGLNLTGFRKMYVFRKKIRIVYRIIEDKLIIYIISIGKRDKGAVNDVIGRRIDL